MPAPSQPRAAAALIVGIGDYKHAGRIARLRYAPRDAKALARLLTDPAVCNFPAERVAVLTQERARRDRVVRCLSRWLPEQSQAAEVAVVYFAGHGLVQKVGSREEGFLLPYDADPDDVVTRGIAMSDVARWIDAIGAAAVIVCLDCCHAGKVVFRETRGTRDLELRPAVLQTIAGKGRFLIASCDEGQKSLEAEELGHGLFTYHLLRGLKGAGDRDGDGKVGIAELFNYVSTAVARDAQEKFGCEQRPWTSATWADDVYLSHPQKCDVPLREPPEAATDVDQLLATADEARLVQFLRQARARQDTTAIPAVFRCLAHASEPVRRQAKRAVQAIGWAKAAAAIEAAAPRGDPTDMGAILDGLAAFEAHADVVHLLDRLVARLHGDLRNRTILLLERKRLALELDKVAALFRDIKSPYLVHKALGQGLLTAAYLARVEGSSLEVVVRVLRPEFAAQPQVRARFMDLAHQSLGLVHHHLVLTREVRAFPEQHLYYFVRDYVPGVTLQKLLDSGKRFTPRQIREILRQLLEALTPLHARGLHHGGIKPSNVFIREGDTVVLGDPSLPVSGVGLALERLSYDYRYAAPETFRSGGPLAPPADFYSLGCVAYELACGQPPFVSDNYLELAARHGREPIPPPAARGSRLGAGFNGYIVHLLAAAPTGRFPNLREALSGLDAVPVPDEAPPAVLRRPEADSSESDLGANLPVAASEPTTTTTPGPAAKIAAPAPSAPEKDNGVDRPAHDDSDVDVAATRDHYEAKPSLTFIDGPASAERVVLEGDVITLGRSVTCQVVLQTVSASRVHACIVKEEGKYFLMDMESANGTLVNGAQVKPPTRVELRNNDRIQMGSLVCVFQDGTSPVLAPAQLTKETTDPARTAFGRIPLLRQESLVSYQREQSLVSFGGSPASISDADEDRASADKVPGKALQQVGRYVILERIGQGGMGQVYKARDPVLGRMLALKVMRRQGSDISQRFVQEAQALARLRHPHIVPVYEVGDQAEQQFIAMPLIEGGSLTERFRRGNIELRSMVELMEKVARAVQYAHEQGVVHRDLKPGNILLDERGEPLVSDFGLAKLEKGPDPEATGSIVGPIKGTPSFMAPEQWKGEPVGPPTDIYALGAVLYWILTGKPPISGDTVWAMAQSATLGPPPPRSIRPDVDPALEMICLKCLASEPTKRYPSAGALADDLARWLRNEPIMARATGWWQRLRRRLFQGRS